MVEIKCKQCGKTFLVKNYRKTTALFCSNSCKAKHNYDKNLRNIDHSYSIGNQYRKGKKPANSFAKGHIPWNKGLKNIHLSPASEFKKGQIGTNHLPIGSIVERLERNKLRNFIKIAEPNKWTYLYAYIWEKENGKIPKGYVLHHINFVSNDDRLENLICITRAEHINIHRKELVNGNKNRKK